MGRRTLYTAIAIFLTVLDLLAIVYLDWPEWRACSGDMWSRTQLLATAAVAATSIGNVWVQAISRFEVEFGTQTAARGLQPFPIPADTRGEGNV